MNVAFFGEDMFSLKVLNTIINEGFHVNSIIVPYYEDNVNYKKFEYVANTLNVPFLREKNINSFNVINTLKDQNTEVLITTHFQKKLSKELISIPTKASINLHPSLLPKYGGLSPQHWPIINGDQKTGVTIHFMDEEFDTGDIIVQKEFEIPDDIYVFNLQLALLPIYETAAIEALRLVQQGNVPRIKQDHTKSSFFGRVKSTDLEILPSHFKKKAYNLIRAFSKPYAGARFENYICWKATVPAEEEEKRLMLMYKEIGFHEIDNKSACLRLFDGALLISSYTKT